MGRRVSSGSESVIDDARAAFQHTRDHVRPYSTSYCCSSTSGAALGIDDIASPDMTGAGFCDYGKSGVEVNEPVVADGFNRLKVTECEVYSSKGEAETSRLVAPVEDDPESKRRRLQVEPQEGPDEPKVVSGSV